jgi:hypothetical protein
VKLPRTWLEIFFSARIAHKTKEKLIIRQLYSIPSTLFLFAVNVANFFLRREILRPSFETSPGGGLETFFDNSPPGEMDAGDSGYPGVI